MKYSRTIIGCALVAVCASASAQFTITTGFASNNQGNQGASQYFDVITGVNEVTITGWDWSIAEAAGTAFNISIFTIAGGAEGSEQIRANWTFETGGTGVSGGLDQPAPITMVSDIVLAANTRTGISFHTSPTAAFRYTTGLGDATYGNDGDEFFSDANVSLLLGAASNSPFNEAANGFFLPRLASFNMHYNAIPEPGSMIALGIGVAALLARRRRKVA